MAAAFGLRAGRNFVTGYLYDKIKKRLPERQVGRALKELFPEHHQLRVRYARNRLVRRPIETFFVGEQLHIDQNEKLQAYVPISSSHHLIIYVRSLTRPFPMQRYSVYLFAGVDAHSRYPVFHVAATRKTAIIPYMAWRCAVRKYGLWFRVIGDKGSENVLVAHFQRQIGNVILPPRRRYDDPYRALPSTSNVRVERFWAYSNTAVARPLLPTLDHLRDHGYFDLSDPCERYCVAEATCIVAAVLIRRLKGQVTHHYVARVGRPVEIFNQFRGNVAVPEEMLLKVEDAVAAYPGEVAMDCELEGDPLRGHAHLQEQRFQLLQEQADVELIADDLLASYHPRYSQSFADFVLSFITVTQQLVEDYL
ncbi:hypothetical protein BCR44DRAFT_27981 [Catenaria anguillulae PL171]|uniref:Integrase core domain-containing protein n=1 Tax=Catenaria anguillulae PL171 TaxID=765915 RepID=A0A1Y2H7H9_9FUNG|nr:hypothetical protein BCR44DRAFT_27981 [Catenaria anguillulae PL171]